ncbi:M48 family metallopeptidase [Clostridium bowmanii]|uniref:M48 family metallopeptidase n=1 Tax=Clostridium bowmanii TaxID=132925 RepID=UPI001C0DB8F5|nr:SprT family zinc-dependent metalloprotease [Clostridium bowmanii]MBU3190743.1 M48 family metallopeptidase [Clostridium bowmanii]MCA1075011.1 M48 family metallopeptidase [Clostridium bowmanii]
MKLSFKYGTTNIAFNVEYKNRKTMEIAVEAPNIITVIAPMGTSEEKIVKKVKSKANWIIQKIYSYKHMHYEPINREFVNGESFMYLGRNYSLQIELNLTIKNPDVKLYRGKFIVTAPNKDEEDIRNAMEQWYRNKAKQVISDRIKYYQKFFNIVPTVVKVKEQKKRWGSCTSKNQLLFNWRCIMAKANAMDYIIVHEMCHMYHKNHSKEFWELVASVLPDYEIRKEWLKNYGVRMDL